MSDWLKNIVANFATLGSFLHKQQKRIATIFVGHGLYSILGWFYNNPLYVLAIAYFGLLWGGISMTFGSMVICFLFLRHYQKKKIEWLGYDALDDLKAQGIEYAKKLKGWSFRKMLASIPAVLFIHFPLAAIVPILWLIDKIVWLWLDTDAIARSRARCINKLKEAKEVLCAVIFFIPANLFRLLMWLLRVGGDVIAFFALCIWEDPFITTAYLRHGRCDGLTKKDLFIFFASVLVSNGYWIARTYAVIEVAKIAIRSLFY